MQLRQEYEQAIKELGQAYNFFNNVVDDEEVTIAIIDINIKELKVKLIRETLGEKV